MFNQSVFRKEGHSCVLDVIHLLELVAPFLAISAALLRYITVSLKELYRHHICVHP